MTGGVASGASRVLISERETGTHKQRYSIELIWYVVNLNQLRKGVRKRCSTQREDHQRAQPVSNNREEGQSCARCHVSGGRYKTRFQDSAYIGQRSTPRTDNQYGIQKPMSLKCVEGLRL